MSHYALTLTPDDNDTFLVTCDALPEVTSFGDTEAEAVANGTNAVLEALAGRLAKVEFIPSPRMHPLSPAEQAVVLPLRAQAKVRLANAMVRRNVSRAELARRLKAHREQVDRLFRLITRHVQTKSKPPSTRSTTA